MTRQRSTLSRAHLTNWLVTTLSLEGLPVGDNSTPTDPFGWQGQPNSTGTNFIPWMSVTNGTARPRPLAQNAAFGDAGEEHTVSYAIQYAAVTREQVEWMADKMRKVFANADRTEIDCFDYGVWRILQAQCISIGGISRIRSALPDYYTQTDNFDLWVSRKLNS
jgi:GTPase SAR1 family protein